MTKISDLTAATSAAAGDIFEIETVAGTSKKIAKSDIFGGDYHAVTIQPTATTTVNVNSTSYIAIAPFNFYLDRDTFPATHFRFVMRGRSTESGQTATFQLASATAPTTPLHTGGDDVVVTFNGGSNTTFDSGWRTLDDGGTGLLFGAMAVKGSNSTVDISLGNAVIMFKK